MFRVSCHLQRHSRSGIFYFRLTVPARLRHLLHKREIKKSLGTGRRAEAIPLAQGLYCKYYLLFQKLERCGMDDNNDAFFRKITIDVGGQPVVIERDDPAEEAKIASTMLGATGKSPQKNKATPVKQLSANAVSLTKMIKAFMTEKNSTNGWDEKTTEENAAIYQLLKEVLKNPTAETIGIKQAVEFKNVLLRLPPNRSKGANAGKGVQELAKLKHPRTLSNSSVNKYLRRVSSLFDWGKRHGYVHENPFIGLGVKELRMPFMQRDRFRIDEIKKLLDPSLLNADKLRHQYCFWLPWLGLFSGARLEELCQLHLEDVRQVGDVWVFDINGKGEKRLKTPAAERLVPVHSQLILIGLLDYAERLRLQGEKRLFPELRQRRDGYGQTASKWFGRYRQKIGITKPFHSLRHTFVDELRQLGADHKKIAALVGHVDESMTGGRYGKPFKPDVLKPVVELLTYDL